MGRMLSIILFFKVLLGDVEVIEVSGEFEGINNESWYAMSCGGLQVNVESIYLTNKNKLYIQSRINPGEVQVIETNINGESDFKLTRVLDTESSIYFSLFPGDGRYYLSKVNKQNMSTVRIIEKHGAQGRLNHFNNKVYASGLYWPLYIEYLDNFRNHGPEKVTGEARVNFNTLFKQHEGFTVSVYDSSLNLIDSINTLSRKGENAAGFNMLYLSQPCDIGKNGDVLLIDNDQGYVVEIFNAGGELKREFNIANSAFTPVPLVLNEESATELRRSSNKYSIVYALYEDSGIIMTSFFQSVKQPGLPDPPFHYDLHTTGGDFMVSGESKYPIVGEDENGMVFFFKVIEGGWFQVDRLFLVGLTIQDIVKEGAMTERIDTAVNQYVSE